MEIEKVICCETLAERRRNACRTLVAPNRCYFRTKVAPVMFDYSSIKRRFIFDSKSTINRS